MRNEDNRHRSSCQILADRCPTNSKARDTCDKSALYQKYYVTQVWVNIGDGSRGSKGTTEPHEEVFHHLWIASQNRKLNMSTVPDLFRNRSGSQKLRVYPQDSQNILLLCGHMSQSNLHIHFHRNKDENISHRHLPTDPNQMFDPNGTQQHLTNLLFVSSVCRFCPLRPNIIR